jgi:hypothetical protein
VYDLAPTAQFLFPQSYSQLLEVLQERMTPEEGEDLLRTVGWRMAAQWTIQPGELSVRLEAAVEVLNELGGLMERETGEEPLCICGYRCPFAAVVLENPWMRRLCRGATAAGWPSGIWYSEATPWHTVIVTVFLNRHPNQLRQERLGEATHCRMAWCHCGKRATIAADSIMTVTLFKFCHPAEFSKDLDSCLQSHTQIS